MTSDLLLGSFFSLWNFPSVQVDGLFGETCAVHNSPGGFYSAPTVLFPLTTLSQSAWLPGPLITISGSINFKSLFRKNKRERFPEFSNCAWRRLWLAIVPLNPRHAPQHTHTHTHSSLEWAELLPLIRCLCLLAERHLSCTSCC